MATEELTFPKYTLGIGDRFGRQGVAQLKALVAARAEGIEVSPVWNKSNREHLLVGTEPSSVRAEADAAVAAVGWTHPYFVDADHIGLKTVDRFIQCCDFFTIDVADALGKPPDAAALQALVAKHASEEPLRFPGLSCPIDRTPAAVEAAAHKFLAAMIEAGQVYRHVRDVKGASFIVEVSTDEASHPQSPSELYVSFSLFHLLFETLFQHC